MRLWTLHTKYLDAKGLVALWREGLLAKAVLEGKTRGYVNHPQLIRFRSHSDPLGFVNEYLREILGESRRRGYKFDATKLTKQKKKIEPLLETSGQLAYEWQHLLNKLNHRDQDQYQKLIIIETPEPHPLFRIIAGGIQSWEKYEKDD